MATWYRAKCGEDLGPFDTAREAEVAGAIHESRCSACHNWISLTFANRLAPGFYGLGIGALLGEEARTPKAAHRPCPSCRRTDGQHAPWCESARDKEEMVNGAIEAQKEAIAKNDAQLATIKRVRAHQVAEGGPSATLAAPGRVRDTFADLCSEWDLLPEAGR